MGTELETMGSKLRERIGKIVRIRIRGNSKWAKIRPLGVDEHTGLLSASVFFQVNKKTGEWAEFFTNSTDVAELICLESDQDKEKAGKLINLVP